MHLAGTEIVDTFAEGFRMVYTRLEITAADEYWLDQALRAFCGYGTSVIACDAEVGVERRLLPSETTDGRPGALVLLFGFSAERLGAAVPRRVGQCIMTCPTTAVFSGLHEHSAGELELGRHLRFFGDGFQLSKLLGERRFWRIPVMDGEFIAEESAGIAKGVAGGNFMIQGVNQAAALAAARRAVSAIDLLPGVITPFPGGVVRSGSKVGSKYAALKASTNHAYCPTLRAQVASEIAPGAGCVYEIVVDGVDEAAVAGAMRAGIEAASGEGIPAISAGNYGGKLGKFQFHLHSILRAKTGDSGPG